MAGIFKNIPEEIEKQILVLSEDDVLVAYRAVPNGNFLSPEDFYPTFAGSFTNDMKSKGTMAQVIASQTSNDISYFSLSLSLNKDVIIEKFMRRKNKRYKAIAKGFCDKNKGLPHIDNSSHVSFYLFDYENKFKNPYNDFVIDEIYE